MVLRLLLLQFGVLGGLYTLATCSPTQISGFSRTTNAKRYPLSYLCPLGDEQDKLIGDMDLVANYAQGPLYWLLTEFDATANL